LDLTLSSEITENGPGRLPAALELPLGALTMRHLENGTARRAYKQTGGQRSLSSF